MEEKEEVKIEEKESNEKEKKVEEVILEKYNLKSWFKSAFTGLLLGLAVILPGISGSTIAILFKLYDMSIRTGGILNIESRLAADGYIRYLADECKTNIPFMDRAMSYYLQHGFAKIDEKGEDVKIHFPYVEDNLITWDETEG